MSNAIQPLAFAQSAEPVAPVGARGGAGPGFDAAPAQPATTQVRLLNPALRIDSALGLVVTEFYNDAGIVAASIPTARQLDAYRIYGRSAGTTTPAPIGTAFTTAATGADRNVQATANVASAAPANGPPSTIAPVIA